MLVIQEEESRKRAQEVDGGVNQNWAAVYQNDCKKDVELLGQTVKL